MKHIKFSENIAEDASYGCEKAPKREQPQKAAPDSGYDDNYDTPQTKKWFHEFLEEPTDFKPLDHEAMQTLRKEASALLHGESLAYETKMNRSGSSDQKWAKSLLTKGAMADRVAAATVLIQDSPLHHMSTLKSLVAMVKPAKKKDSITVIETLSELFIYDLLLPETKLRTFEVRPASELEKMSSGNRDHRRKILLAWIFEDQLKETYVAITPFNMKEELEEGHFDQQGHYHWKREKEVKDSWLDNIDWVKVQGRPEDKYKVHKDDTLKGLGDESSSDSDTEEAKAFDLVASYREMLVFMKPKETVLKCLQRLGANAKISSAERWKRKKAGIVDTGSESVTKLTSVANEILTRTGNMDIYQETYEKINAIIGKADKKSGGNSSKVDVELDMYADDFDTKEKDMITDCGEEKVAAEEAKVEPKNSEADLMWEFKWTQTDDGEVHGPHSTAQMQKWVTDGFFKTGVWVKKCGQDGPFYTSNRIDFELYL